jgi:putative oxidoreductase
MDRLRGVVLLAGRLLIAAVFVYDAVLLLQAPAANMAYMARFGVPGFLLWPTAIFELVVGALLVLGLAARAVALAFAGFCLLTALVFHSDFADIAEIIQFGKDIGLAGGFLFLLAAGPGPLALDRRVGRPRGGARPRP